MRYTFVFALKTNNHPSATGSGKSCLVQSVQVAARNQGYFASAKFDQARKSPFEPVLRLMSSLFRQIFSESDVGTDFHNHIRTFIRPLWHILHLYLDLPEWFLNSSNVANDTTTDTAIATSKSSTSSRISPLPQSQNASLSTTDWLRTGGATKSSRFMNIFLGALRVLASQKFICLCIEDLQFADNESLELVQRIVSGKVPLLLMLTYRDENELPTSVAPLLRSSTKIELKHFNEEETAQYVSTTLHREKDTTAYLLPLVAVVQEKTAGNPFFIREMLDTCYRKGCVYYSWKNSAWEFDLDKVFTEFESQSYGDTMTNDFVAKRLEELPKSARALLAWASLLGNSFTFSLAKRLLSGEKSWPKAKDLPVIGSHDPVSGLQNALSAYIIMPCEDEDRFRFSHDRYMQAAASLVECYNKSEMHFAIARIMIEKDFQDNTTTRSKSLYVKSQHICAAADLLKAREKIRGPYRALLLQAAVNASESGARSTALFYWAHCLTLLQDKPWDSRMPDVDYQETLTLYTRAAEAYWYQREFDKAMEILDEVFKHARTAMDCAPCMIIKSRVYAVQGNSHDAFTTLKAGLAKLGHKLPDTTFEACDALFEKTSRLLKSMDHDELVAQPARIDPVLDAVGPVLVEMVSAAFWSNSLLFFQISLIMIDVSTALSLSGDHCGTHPS
jgi:predicted ATPase